MAKQTNNPVLAGKVDYTETSLLKTRDDQLVLRCTGIADLATEQLAALAPYGVTPEELNRLKEGIKQFADSLPKGRISVSERKAANATLNTLFVETDALLKTQLDRLMVRYRKNQPEFYATYQTARHIINYGVRHEKAKRPEPEALRTKNTPLNPE